MCRARGVSVPFPDELGVINPAKMSQAERVIPLSSKHVKTPGWDLMTSGLIAAEPLFIDIHL